MKKLKFFFQLAFLLLIFSAKVSAQQITVTWGAEEKVVKNSGVNGIIGEDETGFFVIRTVSQRFKSPKLFLERYNQKDLKMAFSKEIQMPSTNGKDVSFENLFYVNGKLMLFTSYLNKDQMKNFAFVNTVTLDGKVNNDMKELDFIKVEKKKNAGSFDFVLSNDSTKILVYHNEPYDKYANEKFSYKVIDNSLNTVWEKGVQLPYKDKYFSISNYTVDNDGNVFMLARLTDEDMKKSKKDKPNYTYSVLGYFHKTGDLKEYSLSLGNKFIDEVTFRIDPMGNLVTAGFYANVRNSGMSGVFYTRIDRNTKEVITKGVNEFSKDFLAEFMKAKKVAKGEKGLDYSFSLDDLVTRTDGGAILIAEYFNVQRVCTTDPKTGMTTCNYYYYYNDIIAVSIKPDGTIDWTQRIPKKQVSRNDGGTYSSYLKAVVGDKIYFVFNDNPKNINPKKPGDVVYMNSVKKAMTCLVIVDGTTKNIKRTPLFEAKEAKAIMMPKINMQVNASEVIIYARKGAVSKFGKIRIS